MTELISIVIASMGRETLIRTLDSIEAAAIPSGYAIEVVIADDSTDGAVLRRIAVRPSALPIRVVPVAAQNVSIARNASIDAARGDWLLLVDDDEYVAIDWIVEHLNAARDFAADVVFGPVYPVYPEATPEWFRRADPQFHDLGWTPAGRQIDFGQSGNTLIRAAKLRELGMRFDPAFGRTGGEDDDLFRRMAKAGAKLVVTDRAKAWEPVRPERTTSSYVLDRMQRTGQMYARAVLRDVSATRRLAFAIDAFAKLCIAAAGSVVLRPFDLTRAFRMQMKFASNVGKLSALGDKAVAAAWTEGAV